MFEELSPDQYLIARALCDHNDAYLAGEGIMWRDALNEYYLHPIRLGDLFEVAFRCAREVDRLQRELDESGDGDCRAVGVF